jgi:hypothetical protein
LNEVVKKENSHAFVTLRGGGYDFVPGIAAMRFIAAQTS